jgi:hypothetical protein
MKLGTREEALKCATLIACEMLDRMPDFSIRGMCVAVCDERGETVSILPLDPMS